MQLVSVRYRTGEIPNEFLVKLVSKLPGVVASALDVGGQDPHKYVSAADISIDPVAMGELYVSSYHLEIIVWANDFPERRANLDKRKEFIRLWVQNCLDEAGFATKGVVWLLLAPGAFGEI